jgi:hypothetical protein
MQAAGQSKKVFQCCHLLAKSPILSDVTKLRLVEKRRTKKRPV